MPTPLSPTAITGGSSVAPDQFCVFVSGVARSGAGGEIDAYFPQTNGGLSPLLAENHITMPWVPSAIMVEPDESAGSLLYALDPNGDRLLEYQVNVGCKLGSPVASVNTGPDPVALTYTDKSVYVLDAGRAAGTGAISQYNIRGNGTLVAYGGQSTVAAAGSDPVAITGDAGQVGLFVAAASGAIQEYRLDSNGVPHSVGTVATPPGTSVLVTTRIGSASSLPGGQTRQHTRGAVEITTTSLPAGKVGTPYNAPLSFLAPNEKSGTSIQTGLPDLLWGGLPPGLAWGFASSSGPPEMTGTPTEAGSYRFAVSVPAYWGEAQNTQGVENSALAVFTIDIQAGTGTFGFRGGIGASLR